MASTSFLYSLSTFLPFHPVTSKKSRNISSHNYKVLALRREAGHDWSSNGRLVDENMIVLRKRIHEMKVEQTNYEPPQEWMDWEKGLYSEYDSIICDAMGHLQSYLMKTRPSLVLAVFALVALSVPTSMAAIVFHLLQITKGVLFGIHLG